MARKVKKSASWNQAPQLETEYIDMGNELIEWAKQEDSMTIDGFPISKMLAPSAFHELPTKSAQFSQAYDLALGIIGLRRERLAHEGAINAQIVKETMPLYDPIYRKWLICERNKAENVGAIKFITVGIPTYLQCPDGSHTNEVHEFSAQEGLKAESQREQILKVISK